MDWASASIPLPGWSSTSGFGLTTPFAFLLFFPSVVLTFFPLCFFFQFVYLVFDVIGLLPVVPAHHLTELEHQHDADWLEAEDVGLPRRDPVLV